MKTKLTAIDSNPNLENTATALTRERYQPIATIYDRLEGLMERRFQPWREKIWQFARAPRILEVGVGTGKNMEFWPADCKSQPLISRLVCWISHGNVQRH